MTEGGNSHFAWRSQYICQIDLPCSVETYITAFRIFDQGVISRGNNI